MTLLQVPDDHPLAHETTEVATRLTNNECIVVEAEEAEDEIFDALMTVSAFARLCSADRDAIANEVWEIAGHFYGKGRKQVAEDRLGLHEQLN